MSAPQLLAVALGSAFLLSPVVLALTHNRIVDIPNDRSSHITPTPRGGGVAIVGATIITWSLAKGPGGMIVWIILAAAGLLAIVGLLDDLSDLPHVLRLVSQVIIGGGGILLALAWSDAIDVPWLIAPIIVVFVVGYTNAYNFMDGINGIAAAQLAIAGATWWLIGSIEELIIPAAAGAVSLGAALGFLPWNYPRARLFMGDVGSYFVGMWLAGIAVVNTALGVHLLAAMAPLALFGVDSAFTLSVRIVRRESWMSAHRSHVYQRIIPRFGHTGVTLIYLSLSAVIAASLLTWVNDSPLARSLGITAACLVVVAYVALPRIIGLSWVHPTNDGPPPLIEPNRGAVTDQLG